VKKHIPLIKKRTPLGVVLDGQRNKIVVNEFIFLLMIIGFLNELLLNIFKQIPHLNFSLTFQNSILPKIAIPTIALAIRANVLLSLPFLNAPIHLIFFHSLPKHVINWLSKNIYFSALRLLSFTIVPTFCMHKFFFF